MQKQKVAADLRSGDRVIWVKDSSDYPFYIFTGVTFRGLIGDCYFIENEENGEVRLINKKYIEKCDD